MTDERKYQDIARRLREFGYPDVTAATVRAVAEGTKKDAVLTGFLKSMLKDYAPPPGDAKGATPRTPFARPAGGGAKKEES